MSISINQARIAMRYSRPNIVITAWLDFAERHEGRKRGRGIHTIIITDYCLVDSAERLKGTWEGKGGRAYIKCPFFLPIFQPVSKINQAIGDKGPWIILREQ